jgi:hypothetical protein
VATPPVQLRPEQVEAAQAIYRTYADGWRRTDGALAALSASMPSFNSDAVLVKVATVNSLYGTNVYAVDRAALHVTTVVDAVDRDLRRPELVEEMAAIPPRQGGAARMHRSFASKFAHFFVDHDAFPIYDSYAARMLRVHLGADAPAPDTGATYMAFEAAFRTLAQSAGLGSDTRRLDRYLWMVGQYRDYVKNSSAQISSELRSLFDANPPELAVAAGSWYRPRS